MKSEANLSAQAHTAGLWLSHISRNKPGGPLRFDDVIRLVCAK